jgi:hypothetical protein
MPAESQAQQAVMAIAEHHPEELHAENKGLLKMTHKQLHDFASTPAKHLPEYVHKSTPYHLAHTARKGE